MTAEELYNRLVEAEEAVKKHPLVRAYINTYTVIKTGPTEQNYTALSKILEAMSKDGSDELVKLLEEIEPKDIVVREQVESPAWLGSRPDPKATLPPLSTQLQTLASSLVSYARSGFANVSDEVYNRRKGICDTCPFWERKAMAGMGRCMKCGCSGIKLKLAVSSCPIKKWLPEVEPPTS